MIFEENNISITQEVKESLNIIDIDYNVYCNDYRNIGTGYRINGYEVYIYSITMEPLVVYLSCKVYKNGEYEEHDVIVLYDAHGNINVNGDFSHWSDGELQSISDVMQSILKCYIPENLWKIKAMLN